MPRVLIKAEIILRKEVKIIMALSLFLLVSLAVIACAQEGDEGDPGDVIVLDQSNFAEGVNKDLVLVEFYAPW